MQSSWRSCRGPCQLVEGLSSAHRGSRWSRNFLLECTWKSLAEPMEVMSWSLAAHGGAVMSSWRSLWSMRFAFGIGMEEPPSPRFFRRQQPKDLVAPSRKLKFPRRPIHPAQSGTGRPLPCSQTAGGTSHAHAGSRTRVTSMGGLYDAATLRAPVASRMHTHRYRLSQAILPSSELSASMAGISGQKASP